MGGGQDAIPHGSLAPMGAVLSQSPPHSAAWEPRGHGSWAHRMLLRLGKPDSGPLAVLVSEGLRHLGARDCSFTESPPPNPGFVVA